LPLAGRAHQKAMMPMDNQPLLIPCAQRRRMLQKPVPALKKPKKEEGAWPSSYRMFRRSVLFSLVIFGRGLVHAVLGERGQLAVRRSLLVENGFELGMHLVQPKRVGKAGHGVV